MKVLSPLVLLTLLLACSPQSGQTPDKTAAAAAAPETHATDAPLREGMGRIRLSVDALGHYEQGHMGAEQAVEMAGNVEKDVNFLIANCRLDPDADAALHGIIAKLLKGAHALKSNPADLAAIAPMREAMAEYAASFDDPAFRTQPASP
ncbi:MAG: hypothetical protein A3E01_16575 [Gammaproteobacteria bacterium RIFCSPHIGHO2_12_FULL_63_22]|nr:MAG: hypothetical protein A3E01_16575 [Gammaproteobacteria bacterium RIFCSPHIGHO2_12_FULL_63_22]